MIEELIVAVGGMIVAVLGALVAFYKIFVSDKINADRDYGEELIKNQNEFIIKPLKEEIKQDREEIKKLKKDTDFLIQENKDLITLRKKVIEYEQKVKNFEEEIKLLNKDMEDKKNLIEGLKLSYLYIENISEWMNNNISEFSDDFPKPSKELIDILLKYNK